MSSSLLRDLIQIPESVHKGDLVYQLADEVADLLRPVADHAQWIRGERRRQVEEVPAAVALLAWVEPIEGEARSRWLGDGQPWSAALCDAIRIVLGGEDPAAVTLTARALGSLEEIREQFEWVRPGRTAVRQTEEGVIPIWWTFAGIHANAGLMAAMGPLLGGNQPDNLAIKLDPAAATVEMVREFAAAVDVGHLPRPSIAETLSGKLKFADALPADLAVDIAAARTADPNGVGRAVSEPVDGVRHASKE